MDPVNKFEMAQFVLMSRLGAFLFHGFLIINGNVLGVPTIQPIKDTLNAVFPCNALYHPFNALAKKLEQGLKALSGASRAVNAMAAAFLFGIAISYLVFLIYFLYPLAAVHGTSIWPMLWPSIAFAVLTLALPALFFRALGIRPKSSVTKP